MGKCGPGLACGGEGVGGHDYRRLGSARVVVGDKLANSFPRREDRTRVKTARADTQIAFGPIPPSALLVLVPPSAFCWAFVAVALVLAHNISRDFVEKLCLLGLEP